jgi:hypothetical protein
MNTPRYSFGLEGSSHLLGAAAEVQEEIVEPFFETSDWQYDYEYFEAVPALYQRRQPMLLGGSEIALATVFFMGSCFAKKIFDEVYERTLKRPIGAQLDRLFNKIKIPAGKVVEYRDVIYFEDIDLVVVIRAIATKETSSDIQYQVGLAHRVAHSYIEQNGKKAPIHCHKILDGHIAVLPELFETLEAIKQHDRAQLKVTVRK